MTQIPEKILNYAPDYIFMFTHLRFTPEEVQALCDEGGISDDIVRIGEFATEERGMFQDVIAKIFAGRSHWPINMDSEDPTFRIDMLTGMADWLNKRATVAQAAVEARLRSAQS